LSLGYGLSSLAIRRFDRTGIFASAAHDDDASASQIGANAAWNTLNDAPATRSG
jgi:hypothetical protein